MKKPDTRYLTHAAIIAALYAVLTTALAPISFGGNQLRVSEALTLLPVLTPAAVPGLIIGCLLSNIYGAAIGATMMLDIVVGTLATALAAFMTRQLRGRLFLAALPPIVVNAAIIGLMLSMIIEGYPFYLAAFSVGLGEAVACFGLGIPLVWALRKLPKTTYNQLFDVK